MVVNSDVQNLIVVRLVNGQLAWYPPGAGDELSFLDDDVSRERLRTAAAQRRGNLVFAAPGTDVRLLQLELSPEEKKHIGSSLAFLLEDQVATDIEDLHFASQPVAKLGLSVAVVSHDAMQEWQDQLSDFPAIARWIPEPLLLPWQPAEWCLVLDGESALLRHGQNLGFGIETALLPALLEALVAGNEELPEAVIVYGQDQAADTALLPEALHERVQWRRGSLGSALLLSDSAAKPVNLRQGDYAPRLPLARWWRQWQAVAAVFAVAFVLQLLATYVDYRQLKQENLELRTAIDTSYRRANPKGAAPEKEKQLARQLASLRGTAQSGGFINLMERVGAVIAQRPGTVLASINYSDRAGEMRMNIIAADFEAVEAIRAGMNDAGLAAVMESSNAQGDKVRARIRVGEKS